MTPLEIYTDDDCENTITLKLLKGRVTRDDGCDGKSYMARVVAPVSAKGHDLSNLIGRHFTYSYCQHEHDCCGCPSHSGYARRVSKREYVLEIITGYNL